MFWPPIGPLETRGPLPNVTAPVLKRGVECTRIKSLPTAKQAVAVILAAKASFLLRVQ